METHRLPAAGSRFRIHLRAVQPDPAGDPIGWPRGRAGRLASPLRVSGKQYSQFLLYLDRIEITWGTNAYETRSHSFILFLCSLPPTAGRGRHGHLYGQQPNRHFDGPRRQRRCRAEPGRLGQLRIRWYEYQLHSLGSLHGRRRWRDHLNRVELSRQRDISFYRQLDQPGQRPDHVRYHGRQFRQNCCEPAREHRRKRYVSIRQFRFLLLQCDLHRNRRLVVQRRTSGSYAERNDYGNGSRLI